MYQGFWALFSASIVVGTCRKYWRSMKMPEKLYGGMIPCNQSSLPMDFQSGLLVQADLCVLLWPGVWYVWLADCLGGLACCRTGSRVGLLRAESQRRYKNCQMCHYHISWDYLWVAYEMLRQQHEAILIWHFKRLNACFSGFPENWNYIFRIKLKTYNLLSNPK